MEFEDNTNLIDTSSSTDDSEEASTVIDVDSSGNSDHLIYSENLRFVYDKNTDSLPITRTLISNGLPCANSPGFRIPK